MDTRSFLVRVVPAQGNYLTITWKSPQRGWAVRSFNLAQDDQIDQAVSWLRWAANKGADTYFALAAFNVAGVGTDTRGQPVVKAERTQANVHLIKTLVMDADVKRDGDKKDPAKVFSDKRAAVAWLLDFTRTTGFPMPNLGVNSGYGLHWYWLFEDALTLQEWQPLANALKAGMLKNNWVGDTSITIDGARILRPPGTVNVKSGTPVPVEVLQKFSAADYPNQQLLDALKPWMGVVAQAQATGTHPRTAVVTPMLGPRPSHITPGVNDVNQAAHAGMVSRYKFEEIAKRCAQVKLSLTNHGLGDPYPLWYLGHISLAEFTSDGKLFVHEISNGDPRYTPENVDAHVARAATERVSKGHGAPTCKHYNDQRPGVCDGCPLHGKGRSPLSFGLDPDAVDDLPRPYRRAVHAGEPWIERLEGKDKGAEWVRVIEGTVSKPRLDELPAGGHRLTFTYSLAGKDHPVAANGADMGHHMPLGYFEKQGVSVGRHNAAQVGDLVVAWINKLRMQQIINTGIVRPFGWNFDAAGAHVGVAIAGTLYRCDGSEEAVPGGDQEVASMYRPVGELANWRKAAALFEGGRADLQALIAMSFAAPLVSLCGDVRGTSLNFWSTGSGPGKSTAIKVGQSVWGGFKTAQAMTDTPNAVMHSLAEPRILIRYWDELKILDQGFLTDFVKMIFIIPQGKERARLQSNITMREVGEWETLLVFTANRSLQDYILSKDDSTDSGLARLLEVEVENVPMPFNSLVGQHIKLCETNYGHAGRVFIKHIATNLVAVQAQLAGTMKLLGEHLNMQSVERYSVTAITCALVGAALARKLDLFNFDVSGIRRVLVAAFENQRTQRIGKTLLSEDGGFDLEGVVSEYYSAMAEYRIRTDKFSIRGGNRIRVLQEPRSKEVRLQVAEQDGTLRIDIKPFETWLRFRGRPSTTIIKDLKEKMGAKEDRVVLGGGTDYASGRTFMLDVPLTGRLASIVTDAGTRTGQDKTLAEEMRDDTD